MTKSIKSIALGLLLLGGITLTSCKKETNTTTETENETTEMVESSTDTADGDTVVTDTDSITEANRDDKSMSVGTQVP